MRPPLRLRGCIDMEAEAAARPDAPPPKGTEEVEGVKEAAAAAPLPRLPPTTAAPPRRLFQRAEAREEEVEEPRDVCARGVTERPVSVRMDGSR